MKRIKRGLFFTCLLSIIVIIVFYGKVFKDINNVYFASGGDGFKSYYGAIYHLKHDSSYFHFQGMNYPYGESVFFTDNQPLITNTVKFISENLVDINDKIVGIINASMIISILIAALFIFLIFSELGLSWWFASIASVGICILSPQIGRMSGHFSLTHLFWIPLLLFLILRFSKKPAWKYTLLIFFSGFFAAAMHLYFAGFFGLLLTIFWLFYKNWFRESWLQRGRALLHWFIQALLPVVIVQLIMVFTDGADDRTTHPYGFLVYLAHPVSVLLPGGAPYGFVRKVITIFDHLDWEAYAFIGVVALTGFIIGCIVFIRKIVYGKAFWKICDHPVLNIFFWASLLSLFISFGLPFKLGFERLVDYIGPFRQLRALSRFSWLFYYVINILVFYQFYNWFKKREQKFGAKAIVIVAFGFLFIDGYYNIKSMASNILNFKPVIADSENRLSDNEWIREMNFSDFQSIMPIPYFHIGSENIWIDSKNNSLENTLITSLKSGLPTTAVMMGRTSISQTYKNYNLLMEPLSEYGILLDFKNRKDILLLWMKGYQPNKEEERIINLSTTIAKNSQFEVLRLPFDKLSDIPREYHNEVLSDYRKLSLIKESGLMYTDTTSFSYYNSYDKKESSAAYSGTGAFRLNPIEWNNLYEAQMTGVKSGDKYLISFWLKDFMLDGYSRFNAEIQQCDKNGKSIDYLYKDIHPYIRAIDGEWALFEIPFRVKMDDVLISCSIRNAILQKADYIIDELLIRKDSVNVFQIDKDTLRRNTRKFRIE